MTTIVEIYTTGYCSYCVRAKALLDTKGVSYVEIRVDDNPEKRQEMEQRSHRKTVPQIFINGQHIGGCDDLYALDAKGNLDPYF
jgi:glutaredoxin 3